MNKKTLKRTDRETWNFVDSCSLDIIKGRGGKKSVKKATKRLVKKNATLAF